MSNRASAESLEKVLYALARRTVFERLGTIEQLLPAQDFSAEEKLELGPVLLGMIEKACQEFVAMKRERWEKRREELKKEADTKDSD